MKVSLFLNCLIAVLITTFAVSDVYGIQSGEVDQPNIIFIMADDLGYGDLGSYGQELMKTPHIDQLAQDGLRFTQAYASPVCTPTRSILMTGLHNGRTPARDNIPHYHTYLQEEDITVAEILQDAGYRTGGVGKWSLGDAGTAGSAMNKGFDFWLGYLNQDHAHYYYPEYLDYNHGQLALNGNTYTRDRYSHDLLTNGALQFIRDSYKDPFFLYVAYTLPHFSSESEDIHGLTVPTTDPYSDKDWPEHAKKYAVMIHMIDRDVGRIIQKLEKLGIEEETLIIFTSDNGGHSTVWEKFQTNGPLRGFKRNLWEGGIHVPFIVKWPGHTPAGEKSDELIALQDMMPTFAEIAHTTPPDDIDGISLLNVFRGEQIEEPREYLYWDYGHARDRYDQAIRTGNWKGLRLGRENEIKLFKLETDIGEEHNVANEHPEIVKKIEKYMNEAVVPSDRYPVGQRYTGDPIWRK